MDLERTAPKMDHFSLHFVTELIRSATGNEDLEMDWAPLLIGSRSIGKGSQRSIASLMNNLEKEKKDVDIMGEVLFRIPKVVSEEKGIPVVYMIDEFQEIKSIHERILHIMRANTEKKGSVNYWVAG